MNLSLYKCKALNGQKVAKRKYTLKDLQEIYNRTQEKKSQNKTPTSAN